MAHEVISSPLMFAGGRLTLLAVIADAHYSTLPSSEFPWLNIFRA
jgi:hypothetical protein